MSHKQTFYQLLCTFGVFFYVFAGASSAEAVDIQEVESKSGIRAYLVENHTNPIITIAFTFAGGTTQDPVGKEGLVRLLSSMMDEGSGEMSGQEFQALSEDLGIDIRFSASRDNFNGTLQTLVENSEKAYELLQLALTKPRFDKHPMDRMRDAISTGIKRQKSNPNAIASRVMRQTLFEGHPYANSPMGTLSGLKSIVRDDLVAIHNKIFAKENLVIGVVGAVSAQQLEIVIEKIFGDLPQKSGIKAISKIEPSVGGEVHHKLDVPQSVVSLALPGLTRKDPDFFAAYLVNHILGGGTFSSRLYDEVREKRGLAYSVFSQLATYDHAAFIGVGSATRADQVDESLSVIRAELKRMAQDGPSEEELEAAKKFIVGSYAIRNLDTSAKVARTLAAIQEIDLGIDYIDRRKDIINAVTIEDVRRVAKKLLAVEPTIVVVGQSAS